MGELARVISSLVGGNLLLSFVAMVLVSVGVSGFVDNVPFLLTMIPVTQKVAVTLGTPVPLLMFALLVGSCLGGNITPISLEQLKGALEKMKKDDPNLTVQLRADEAIDYGQVLKVVKLLHGARVQRMALVTQVDGKEVNRQAVLIAFAPSHDHSSHGRKRVQTARDLIEEHDRLFVSSVGACPRCRVSLAEEV